jgi:hypothetical protein
MTHQQLVEEWKEKFDAEFVCTGNRPNCKTPHAPMLHGENAVKAAYFFLDNFALAAAKGAAEAGKVKGFADADLVSKERLPATRGVQEAYNAAISQSSRQLQDYFSEQLPD